MKSFVLFIASTVIMIFAVGLAADSSFANDAGITSGLALKVYLVGTLFVCLGVLVLIFYDYYHSDSNTMFGSALMMFAAMGWWMACPFISLNNWFGAIFCMLLGLGLMIWSGRVMLRFRNTI